MNPIDPRITELLNTPPYNGDYRALCDMAPRQTIPMKLNGPDNPWTLILPYYDNAPFLRRRIDMEHGVPNLIIVDDCSPAVPASEPIAAHMSSDPQLAYSLRLFRIEKDVRWNWLAARNIGAHHASTQWLCLTDMDHIIPAGTADLLNRGDFDPTIIYRFERREHTGGTIHEHPNSWWMTRDMFWKVGGYDERMSGFYGSDGHYRRRCAMTAPIRIMDAALERHEHIDGSSTTGYQRKQRIDAQLKQIVAAFPKGSKPKTLSFPYHEVAL